MNMKRYSASLICFALLGMAQLAPCLLASESDFMTENYSVEGMQELKPKAWIRRKEFHDLLPHFPTSRTHLVTSETHYETSARHSIHSLTHLDDSIVHALASGVHQLNSMAHYFQSSFHVLGSMLNPPIGQLQVIGPRSLGLEK